MQTARAARGTKRTCTSCGERFYDLDRTPIVCPECNFAHDPSAFVRIMPVLPVPEEKPKAAPEKGEDDDDLEIEDVELDDDDDDLLPDDDDDDDIADVAVDVAVDDDE
jgi:hypothetical protein